MIQDLEETVSGLSINLFATMIADMAQNLIRLTTLIAGLLCQM
jgi:hypothetical protein